MLPRYGRDTFMWSNDYPHAASTWPHDDTVIAYLLGHLSEDDRAAVPMMPFFEDAIVEQLDEGFDITRPPVRLKIGSRVQGQNYLDMKFLSMAMGTEGGFKAFFEMIGSVISISNELGTSYTDYTDGYTEGDLVDELGDYDNADDDLNNQDPDAAQKAREQWDVEHGDYNHDGYEDACELIVNKYRNVNPNFFPSEKFVAINKDGEYGAASMGNNRGRPRMTIRNAEGLLIHEGTTQYTG